MVIRPRKAQRAFTGLVGLPPEPDEASAAVPRVIEPVAAPVPLPTEVAEAPAPAKRGRKRKYATDNERKLAHKRKMKEPERARMIERILARIRSYLSKPRTDISDSTVQKIYLNHRDWLDRMRASLDGCPYAQIRNYYDVLVSSKNRIADSKGRLPGERSGEAPSADGMSEMETIIAAIDREESGVAVAGEAGGCGADQFEVETDGDDSVTPHTLTMPDEWYLFESCLRMAAKFLADKEWFGPSVYEGKYCRSWSELEAHVIAQYRKGEGNKRIASLAQGLSGGTSFRVETNRYYQCVCLLMSEIVRREREAGKKARKLERLAREARRERNSSPPLNSE